MGFSVGACISKRRVTGVSGCESVSAVGLGALGTDTVESPFGQEWSTALETFAFNAWLPACQGAAAMICVGSQVSPPWLFEELFTQKMYHSVFSCPLIDAT